MKCDVAPSADSALFARDPSERFQVVDSSPHGGLRKRPHPWSRIPAMPPRSVARMLEIRPDSSPAARTQTCHTARLCHTSGVTCRCTQHTNSYLRELAWVRCTLFALSSPRRGGVDRLVFSLREVLQVSSCKKCTRRTTTYGFIRQVEHGNVIRGKSVNPKC